MLIKHILNRKVSLVCTIQFTQSLNLMFILFLSVLYMLRWLETTCWPIKTTVFTWWRLDDTYDVLISPVGYFTRCWFHTVTCDVRKPTETDSWFKEAVQNFNQPRCNTALYYTYRDCWYYFRSENGSEKQKPKILWITT